MVKQEEVTLIQCRVSKEIGAIIRRSAEAEDRPVAGLVRRLLTQYAEAYDREYQKARGKKRK